MSGTREPLHGHNYHCSVIVEGNLLPDGFVVDFGDLKRAARAACDALDHLVLLPGQSQEVSVEQTGSAVRVCYREDRFEFPAADVCVLPIPNTSSEHLARYLSTDILRRLPGEIAKGLRSIRVGVEEAPGQRAYVRRELTAIAPHPL